MEIPFIAWIIQGIPECLGAAALLLSLDGCPLNWRTIGKIGILQGIIAYVIRLMPFTPGVHLFILPISMALLAAKIGRVRLDKALIYAVAIAVLVAIWEMCMYYVCQFCRNITYQQIFNNLSLRIMIGMPQVILLFIFAFLIQKKKFGDRVLRENPLP